MQEYFGIKELYDVALKSTSEIKIGNRIFKKGEPVLYFDKVQIANINEDVTRTAATGGKSNRNLIIWEDTKEVSFTLQEGVMSKIGLALLANANVFEKDDEKDFIVVPKRQQLTLDKNGCATLKYEPLETEPFFVYLNLFDSIEKIEDYSIEGNKLTIENSPNKDIIVEYYFNYKNHYTTYVIGDKLFNGYLRLEGKIYFKDDERGLNQTSLFIMPKVRLASNLNITLGERANPVISTFNIIGFPGDSKNKKLICQMSLLEEDIDSDV